MKYFVYSYRDKLQGFSVPIVDSGDSSAIRGFSYGINGRDGMMNFSPSDFDLYRIGEFDSDTGLLTPISPVEMVISGASVYGDK